MKKKQTIQERSQAVNSALFYLYKHLDSNISLDEIARLCKMSKYHFHRVFKEETKESLFERLTSIRLQKAANLLLVNQHSTISQIALKCGFSSHSSFIKAFKKRFEYTPKDWKNGGYKEYSKKIIEQYPSSRDFESLDPIIKPCKAIHCAYIRHKGYDLSIKKTWQRLLATAYENELKQPLQVALQHDNPTITPLKEASYVACIEVPKDFKKMITLEIPSSLCAIFSLQGKYGDVANLMRFVYHFWLPTSGYEALTLPSYSIYKNNHFLDDDVDLDFYLPITVAY